MLLATCLQTPVLPDPSLSTSGLDQLAISQAEARGPL